MEIDLPKLLEFLRKKGKTKGELHASGARPNFLYKYHPDLRNNEPFKLREIELKTFDHLCKDGLVKNGNVYQRNF